MVSGSGGWRVGNRSPKNKDLEIKKEKLKQRVICRANEDDVHIKRKRRVGAFK